MVQLVDPFSQKRVRANLFLLIKKHIRLGSVMNSDGCGAYLSLKDEAYVHHIVNHSENTVGPETHTQIIERLWQVVKEWVKRPYNSVAAFMPVFRKILGH